MNKPLTAILLALAFLFASCDKEVKEYYLVTTTPKLPCIFFGFYHKPTLTVEIKKLNDYASDSLAVQTEKESVKNSMTFIKNDLDKVFKKWREPEDSILYQADVDAHIELLGRNYYLMAFKHLESYNPGQDITYLKEHWANPWEVRTYIKQNKLKIKIYNLNDNSGIQ